MTIALARRYRPTRFSDLLVQDHVAEALRGAVARGRVGHGYLLTGPRGVGKTTAARILAMALNCERAGGDTSGEPCGECESCRRIWAGSANLDVVEIDAASNRGVDDARDLRERAMYAASQEGHHKVYIVDEAHMLTREAWNALLKILEEPPPGVVFVFATTEPQKIAATAAPVLSRLQRFDFRRIGAEPIQQRLREVLAAEGLEAEEDALLLIARSADGGMRDALSILDQCLSFSDGKVTAERVRAVLGLVDDEAFAEVLAAVARHDPASIFPLVDRLMESGVDLGEFMTGMAAMIRWLLMDHFGASPEGLTERARELIGEYRTSLPPEDLVRMLRLLAESETAIRRSATPRLVVETLLLRWTLMDRTVDLAEVLSGERVGAPDPTPNPPGPRSSGAPRPPRGESRGAEATKSSPPPAPQKPSPGLKVPFTPEAVRERWGELAGVIRETSIILGHAVASGKPTTVEPPWITLAFAPSELIHQEAVARESRAIEEALASVLGAPVRLKVERDESEPSDRPQRLSDEQIQADRLKQLRTTDPALDVAVDELDLELLDEG